VIRVGGFEPEEGRTRSRIVAAVRGSVPPAASASQPEGRRARRRRELHQRIFVTARGLFLAQGLEATTVEQIAEAADVVPATFFNHFPSKEAVIREMAKDVFARFAGLLEEQRKRPVSTQERLLGFAARGARVVQSTPELTRRVLLEVLRTTAPPGETESQLAGVEHQLAELIREGQERGDVRSDREAALLAEIVLSVVHGTISRWINDSDYPLRRRMGEAASFIGEALRPVPDRGAVKP
jgi:AcrR family transcriptional regulator